MREYSILEAAAKTSGSSVPDSLPIFALCLDGTIGKIGRQSNLLEAFGMAG
jgi:hypothetical protein